CQPLNNLLEIQDSQSEMSQNPQRFGDALSDEEHVLRVYVRLSSKSHWNFFLYIGIIRLVIND
ncbi:unnamed protein product, partial [Brassica napus]